MKKDELISCFQDTLEISKGKLIENTIASIKSNRVYKEGFVSTINRRSEHADIRVYSGTTFDIAKKYCQYGKVAVLNFANPEVPGGGVCNGAMAQEECLCRSSNLYMCINNENVFEEYYDYHRGTKNYFYSDRLIYTKDVTVFKNDDTVPQLMAEEDWFNVDVITCAAPYLAKRKYTNTTALLSLFKRRIKNIFEVARENKVDSIVLGAFGCGAFKNPPLIVAEAFKQVIEEENYFADFKYIVFAIKPTSDKCPNLMTFTWQFDEYVAVEEGRCSILPIPLDERFAKKPSLFKERWGIDENSFFSWQRDNKYYGKQFSILGDSISTLDGYNPRGYKVFYARENSDKSGVVSMQDTWWDKVISYFGGELLINNSWSGSRVSKLPDREEMFPSGCSDERTSSLHINEIAPDVIIVYLGTNDWAFGAKINIQTRFLQDEDEDIFDLAYDRMLKKLKNTYPHSEIWCCTLCETYISKRPDFLFPHCHAGIHIEEYNRIIKNVVETNSCKLIDLHSYNTPYDSIDGIHPTSEGMNTIAKMVIQSMLDVKEKSFLECETGRHAYLVKEEHTGATKYVCANCGKIWWHSLLPTEQCLEEEHEYELIGQSGTYNFYKCTKCGKEEMECPWEGLVADENIIVESEYVMRDSDITDILYSDILKLTNLATNKLSTVQKQEVTVGRNSSCDITLINSKISRTHATFFYENKSWFLRDDNSTCGTWLNAMRMEPGKKYQLRANDVIDFAHSEQMIFYCTRTLENEEEEEISIDISRLEAGMSAFRKSDYTDYDILTTVLSTLSKTPLYIPVEIDIAAMLGNIDPMNLKVGEIVQPEQDVRMKILTLCIDNEMEFVPLFTSRNEVEKGQSISTIRYYPQDYIPMVVQMNKPVVINPFSEDRFILDEDTMKNLLLPIATKQFHDDTELLKIAKPTKKDELVGKLINDKYKILQMIGEGGFFKTYLAMDVRLNKQWAMKVLDKTNPKYSDTIHDMLMQEPYMMKKLEHPAIPLVVDIVEDETYIFIVRDYVEGDTLKFIVEREGAQDAEKVIDWGKQLCEVLQYLHSLNPPHIYRDMKPANIVLRTDGSLKLIDFGIMRLYDPRKRGDTCVLGTRGYAAPEQYGGMGQTDARTDIFGLGMTLHHLVTGVNPIEPPYEVKPIREVNPELPIGLEYIISKCIEPNPDNRYQSCDELYHDLCNYENLIGPSKRESVFAKIFRKR